MYFARCLAPALAMTLAACAATPQHDRGGGARSAVPGGAARALPRTDDPAWPAGAEGGGYAGDGGNAAGRDVRLVEGSGRFINLRAAQPRFVQTPAGEFTLNFEGTDLKDVAKTILGDILKETYTVDAKLGGPVFLQTGRALSREDLVPALETLLGAYGAAIVHEGGIYKVVPETNALASVLAPRVQPTPGRGFQNLVVPLRFIAAEEMKKILESLHKTRKQIAVDRHRNLILIGGAQSELRQLLDTIEIFDIDQLQGMSVGIFKLHAVDAKTAKSELEGILKAMAGDSALELVRLLEIERINSLLAISAQKQYLQEVGRWIERIDQAELSAGQGLYVYFVQNSSAVRLAEVLQQLFANSRAPAGKAGGAGTSAAARRTMPDTGPAAPQPAAAQGGTGNGKEGSTRAAAPDSAPAHGAAVAGFIDIESLDLSVIADEERNALIIRSTPEGYAQVEKVLHALDVTPNQVLVEASIIEVTLTDEYSFGLEWFFRDPNLRSSKTGTAQLDLGAEGIAALVPGFSYSIVDDASRIRAVLNTLASDTQVRVISSPSLMVLDNKTATITVGDQVPVRTSETVSTSTSGEAPVITSTIQFRDTGVSLEVTPRVNNGGMVIMDVNQEVSSVDRTTTSSIDSPTINQRQIKTTIAVRSGETIVLGGLIQDDAQDSKAGVPGLRKVPLIGWLFGSESNSKVRTELLVLITPTAILDDSDAREATEELKRKMKGLQKVDWQGEGG